MGDVMPMPRVALGLVVLVMLGGCTAVGPVPSSKTEAASARTTEQRRVPLSTRVEGASGADMDRKFLAFLDEERRKPNGKGLVLFDAATNGDACAGGISVGHLANGKYKHVAALRASKNDAVGFPIGYEPHALPAGDYVIGQAVCGGMRLSGPHATFTVRAGELVDLGVLRFETDRNPPDGVPGEILLKRAATPADAKHAGGLSERAPNLMSRRVYRPMVVTSAEARIPNQPVQDRTWVFMGRR
jgi:hypothetical protein